MPKPRTEDDKKHGDPLEPLIGRTGGEREKSARDAEQSDEDDPALLQDEDDEDIESDDDEDIENDDDSD